MNPQRPSSYHSDSSNPDSQVLHLDSSRTPRASAPGKSTGAIPKYFGYTTVAPKAVPEDSSDSSSSSDDSNLDSMQTTRLVPVTLNANASDDEKLRQAQLMRASGRVFEERDSMSDLEKEISEMKHKDKLFTPANRIKMGTASHLRRHLLENTSNSESQILRIKKIEEKVDVESGKVQSTNSLTMAKRPFQDAAHQGVDITKPPKESSPLGDKRPSSLFVKNPMVKDVPSANGSPWRTPPLKQNGSPRLPSMESPVRKLPMQTPIATVESYEEDDDDEDEEVFFRKPLIPASRKSPCSPKSPGSPSPSSIPRPTAGSTRRGSSSSGKGSSREHRRKSSKDKYRYSRNGVFTPIPDSTIR